MMNGCRLVLGDCLDVMRGLESASIDACVADPPAGIAFMGRSFDNPKTYQSDKAKARDRFLDFLTPRLAACLRVAKPGARLLCWAIPRTSHWTGTAIEDAGWIIEDRLAHVTGQGFPKAKSKLKPAVEDWWMARKPGGGKVPDLNIAACRVGNEGWTKSDGESGAGFKSVKFCGVNGDGEPTGQNGVRQSTSGRYPPNLLLSHHADCRPVGTTRVKGTAPPGKPSRNAPRNRNFYGKIAANNGMVSYADADGLETVTAWACVEGCPVRALDAQSGELKARGNRTPTKRQHSNGIWAASGSSFGVGGEGPLDPGDSGGASRFYPQFTPADDLDFPGLYCPKASRADRGEGNTHPTVKPQRLMRWLCRLICPPGGTVVDPFVGSGTTLLACLAEGFGCLGIESDPEWFAVAERRIAVAERRIAAQRASTPLLA
jgi:DNA modification methylase